MARRRTPRSALPTVALLSAVALTAATGTPADAAVPGWWRPQPVAHATTGSHAFRNFDRVDGSYDGLVVQDPVYRGSAVGRSVLRMAPHTSTRAHLVPTRFPDTNPLSLVRLAPNVKSFAGLTVAATAQGHLYNGLRVDRTRSVHIHDVRVAGVRGDDDAPPGETFGLNDYKTVGSRYSRVEVDGKGKGASGFAANGSRRITIRNSYAHGNAFAMGYAFWHVHDIVMRRDIAANNGWAGYSFERVSGTVVLDRVMSRHNRVDIRIASDRGSASYRIVNPRFDGTKLIVQMPRTYYGRPNRQRRSQIRLIVHGRDRTGDLLEFVR